MIIIKTKTGDILLNEKTTQMVSHGKEDETVTITFPYNKPHPRIIEDVVEVYYANDVHDTQYRSKGCELENLEKRIDEMENKYSLLLKHFDFMRSSYLIYREGLSKIEGLIDKGKAAEDARELIKEAENKYNDLSDSFNKIREKLEKEKMDFLQGKQ